MTAMTDTILRFWLEEVGPERWYRGDAALDGAIRDRFAAEWEAAAAGGREGWLSRPDAALALIILLDQFPRNMFRGTPRAFASDARARTMAKLALARGHDGHVDAPARQFFYMPLMHSESLADQDRCVALFVLRLPGEAQNLLHARAHREVIRMFGRFADRNRVLGRRNSPEEEAYLARGGYPALVGALAARDAAISGTDRQAPPARPRDRA
ncbi:MAG: hypothetical protein KatS3mg118_3655 [Paracoccaceae bacterium]|nr:MAG: hypothetical protein KatS3mg118_3655 [Paracoccaceae bacterium]